MMPRGLSHYMVVLLSGPALPFHNLHCHTIGFTQWFDSGLTDDLPLQFSKPILSRQLQFGIDGRPFGLLDLELLYVATPAKLTRLAV